jgi:hypothetical protein
MQESQEYYQQYVNKNQIPPLEFKVGDKAFVKGPLSWTLQLLTSMHAVHPVFHVSMLELSTPNSVPNCIQLPPAPVIIDEKPKYRISEILDSKLDKQ